MRTFIPMIAIATLAAAAPLAAQTMATPTPKQFVAKAGASDKFEITEGQMMSTSSNPAIAQFAQKMVTDHSDSTAQVKAAAKADGLTPMPPMLDAKQMHDVAALKAAPKGKTRDALYVKQQKAAHAQALALMQAESSGGTTTNLKQAAAKIAPVVQGHIAMLDQMPAM